VTISRNRQRTAGGVVALVLAVVLPTGAREPAGAAFAAGGPDGWKIATPEFSWSFPRDHWAHPGYRTEWWYVTGHLASTADPSRRYGYQFTIFRVGLLPGKPPLDSGWATSDLVMGHAAITDLAAGTHTFVEVLWRAAPPLGRFAAPGERPIAWVRSAPGSEGRWTVDWDGKGFVFAMRDDARGLALDLKTRSAKPLVLQGPNGFSRKGAAPSAASHYYSFTRLATEGSLTLGGRTETVTGVSWMDKEFGSSQLSATQVGWDWLSLQLDDGRDLMLYVLRRADGTPDYRNATIIGRDGTPRYAAPADWKATATASWTSPRTRARYPARWTIEVPAEGLRLDVVPRVEDQENVSLLSGGVVYWEGAVEVRDLSGRPLGRGYVELTGYGEGSRPPI
jgi:predicted secreted hydrolase